MQSFVIYSRYIRTFTCFLLGVDVRTETIITETNTLLYGCGIKLIKQILIYIHDKSVEVLLGPSNLSTDGVFQFSLSTPLQFTANQVLGIYQIRFYSSIIPGFKTHYQTQNGQYKYLLFSVEEI